MTNFILFLLTITYNFFDNKMIYKYMDYKKTYNQTYEKKLHNYINFINNDNFIENHNKNETTKFKLGHNQFSIISNKEYNKRLIKMNSTNQGCTELNYNLEQFYDDENFNWVSLNKITSVKNQLQCGSCWAFSTIGAYENWYAINYNQLLDFSEQQLLDCDKNDNACNGGLMVNGLNYLMNSKVCLNNDYPYIGKKNDCLTTCNNYPKIKGCYNVPQGNYMSLKSALHKNAITIGIDASSKHFQLYKSGVIDETIECSNEINHGVLLVGYGVENGIKYWLIKNSWSNEWGENGYFKLLRKEDGFLCGMDIMANYPY